MDISLPTLDRLRQSVIAVPPLARAADGTLAAAENEKLIRHLERGGINILLYGGNAVFYHLRPSEYERVLQLLVQTAAPSTAVVPAVGPTYGSMMDQAEVLQDFQFPTVMVLPQRDITDPQGIVHGIRAFAHAYGKPVVLYLKFENWLPTAAVKSLVDDGLVSWIKYAVVHDDPAADDELRRLVDAVGGERIISGIGEQPAIVHLRDFGVTGFTSGCVCVAPRRSMQMLRAIQAGDFQTAELIRQKFSVLEGLRNRIHPIRVLHAAVTASGIADAGPIIPLLSEPPTDELAAITAAAESLLTWEREASVAQG